ncbi:MAG: sucrase ferredoxin [Actinobacteria bacterium]|nr:sucrase ferredoxin [Actinomycetota bacterium]
MSTSPAPFPPACAAQARVVEEPLPGTGPETTGWLVIEQPGAWGHDAVTESDLDPDVARTLAERAADLPVRVQIVRRPGHRRSVQRAVFLAHSGPDPWLRRIALQDTRDLLDLDLTVLLSPDEPDLGEPEPAPLYLVCTHAKRDQCCALWGRPVVAALEERRPRQVWESSHVGGHRFAGNVVVLPDGLTYGGLGPDEALTMLEAVEAGEVDLDRLRGRSSLPAPAQAAEVFARRHAGERRADACRVLSVDADGEDAAVTVELAGDPLVVRLRHEPLGVELLAGCDKPAPADPGTWRLVSVSP